MIIINTDSAHFKYYEWLRSLYGYSATPETTSICPYCQTILWGSIFCIVFSPFLITGWIIMKSFRLFLKIENKYLDSIFNWLDDKTRLVEIIDEGPSDFEDGPLVAGIFYTVLGIAALAIMAAIISVVGLFFYGTGYALSNITDVAVSCWHGIQTIAWGIVVVVSLVGYVISKVIEVISALIVCSESIWEWIKIIVVWVVAVGFSGIIGGYLLMLTARLNFIKNGWYKLVTHINGFSEAQKSRKKRKKAREEKIPPWQCKFCNFDNTVWLTICESCSEIRTYRTWWTKFCGLFQSQNRNIEGKEVQMTSTLSLIWEFIKSIKKGICPLVEFASNTELQKQAQKEAKQRSKNKKRNK